MFTNITQLWLEEKDKIIGHCLKK